MLLLSLLNGIGKKKTMNMDSFITNFLSIGITMLKDMKASNELWKDRIRKQWKESQNYPRKKKKKVRKKLMFEWQIANYDPMGLDKYNFDEIFQLL